MKNWHISVWLQSVFRVCYNAYTMYLLNNSACSKYIVIIYFKHSSVSAAKKKLIIFLKDQTNIYLFKNYLLSREWKTKLFSQRKSSFAYKFLFKTFCSAIFFLFIYAELRVMHFRCYFENLPIFLKIVRWLLVKSLRFKCENDCNHKT